MREANVNPPNSIRFGREVCGDLVQAEWREWWLANSLGAYAAGTVAGTIRQAALALDRKIGRVDRAAAPAVAVSRRRVPILTQSTTAMRLPGFSRCSKASSMLTAGARATGSGWTRPMA